MSELNVYHHELRPNEYDEFYLKYEADKVIAELKEERDWLAKDRAQAYDDLEKRAQLNIKQEESIRHQKFKRCLAMAEWCEERDHYLNSLENYQLTDKEYQQVISGCWDRRYKRWLELAKKANALCKEAK